VINDAVQCWSLFLNVSLHFVVSAAKGPLQNRLLFHLSHKFSDEKKLMGYHSNLKDVIEDQLSLASIHYLRSHYQEAIDIYKRILLDNRSEPEEADTACQYDNKLCFVG